jgi:hypothetical protein
MANLANEMKRFDTRKVRKLAPQKRYGELYFHWREAEQMIASGFPEAQRNGRRLKRKIESLYAQWFGPSQSFEGAV